MVNSLTNIIDRELGGNSSAPLDCLEKQITGPFNTSDVLDTFDECFIELTAGDYVFDIDFSYKTNSATVGSVNTSIRVNTNVLAINIDAGDIVIKDRGIFPDFMTVNSILSMHIMGGGKVSVSAPFVYKVGFGDFSDQDMEISEITMRAIKIG